VFKEILKKRTIPVEGDECEVKAFEGEDSDRHWVNASQNIDRATLMWNATGAETFWLLLTVQKKTSFLRGYLFAVARKRQEEILNGEHMTQYLMENKCRECSRCLLDIREYNQEWVRPIPEPDHLPTWLEWRCKTPRELADFAFSYAKSCLIHFVKEDLSRVKRDYLEKLFVRICYWDVQHVGTIAECMVHSIHPEKGTLVYPCFLHLGELQSLCGEIRLQRNYEKLFVTIFHSGHNALLCIEKRLRQVVVYDPWEIREVGEKSSLENTIEDWKEPAKALLDMFCETDAALDVLEPVLTHKYRKRPQRDDLPWRLMSATTRFTDWEVKLVAQNDEYNCGALAIVHLVRSLDPDTTLFQDIDLNKRSSAFLPRIKNQWKDWMLECCNPEGLPPETNSILFPSSKKRNDLDDDLESSKDEEDTILDTETDRTGEKAGRADERLEGQHEVPKVATNEKVELGTGNETTAASTQRGNKICPEQNKASDSLSSSKEPDVLPAEILNDTLEQSETVLNNGTDRTEEKAERAVRGMEGQDEVPKVTMNEKAVLGTGNDTTAASTQRENEEDAELNRATDSFSSSKKQDVLTADIPNGTVEQSATNRSIETTLSEATVGKLDEEGQVTVLGTGTDRTEEKTGREDQGEDSKVGEDEERHTVLDEANPTGEKAVNQATNAKVDEEQQTVLGIGTDLTEEKAGRAVQGLDGQHEVPKVTTNEKAVLGTGNETTAASTQRENEQEPELNKASDSFFSTKKQDVLTAYLPSRTEEQRVTNQKVDTSFSPAETTKVDEERRDKVLNNGTDRTEEKTGREDQGGDSKVDEEDDRHAAFDETSPTGEKAVNSAANAKVDEEREAVLKTGTDQEVDGEPGTLNVSLKQNADVGSSTHAAVESTESEKAADTTETTTKANQSVLEENKARQTISIDDEDEEIHPDRFENEEEDEKVEVVGKDEDEEDEEDEDDIYRYPKHPGYWYVDGTSFLTETIMLLKGMTFPE